MSLRADRGRIVAARPSVEGARVARGGAGGARGAAGPVEASPRRVEGAGSQAPAGAAPRRGGAPRRLAESLDAILERLGIGRGLEDARLFESWEDVVGREIGRVSRPVRLDGDVLIVVVKSSAWMNELSLRRSEILSRINGRRRSRVRRIVFRAEG